MDEQQILSSLKAHVARHQGVSSYEQRRAGLEGISEIRTAAIARLTVDVWASKEAVGQLNPRNPGYLNQLVQAAKKMLQRSLSWYTRSLQGFHSQVARAIEEHGSAINSIDVSLRRLQSEITRVQDELPAIKQYQRTRNELLQSQTTEIARQEQQAPYVDFFRGLSPVVDLGSGRGEFLVLLRERGISAYGVDSDRMVCEAARRKSLKVAEADIFEHLRQLPERSLGGVFSARVIEYLPVHLQAELITLCSKKIKAGGVIVVETTSPESSRGFGRVSYLDPTHLRPIPAELLKSVMESNGFRDIRICVMAPAEACVVMADQSVAPLEARDQVLRGASIRPSDSAAYAAIAWQR
jgi:SAM-dependent methyltransferase